MQEEIAIPIVALSIPIFVVPAILLFKHLGRKRELLHLERMSALERGHPPSFEGSLFWPAIAALGIGAGVPACAVLFAYLTTVRRPDFEEVWQMATLIGVAGVVGGSTLGMKMLRGCLATPPVDATQAKPELDPDAYDTVGRRG